MALSAGDKLGPYEVLQPIGAGGMGEVYKARDTRLQRDVAIKVLPAAVALDAERMARFEREARLLASLDHPNIGAIYGLEESNGTRALILALIEGPTLAARIAAGRIPPEEAVPIARQMAEALEYAHERGVIHRDLKPANVKITPEGTVKVLDFGLAKALAGGGEASSALEDSPTVTIRETQAGVILGTAAYMAPEQTKGRRVDRRADIWAFGVVLFEMLAGEPLFTGDGAAEIMAAILREQPNLDRLPRSTPPAVRRLIERCLIKNPLQRLRDIGEARIALENTGAEPEAAVGGAPSGKLAWIVAGAMAAIGALALWAPWRAPKPADRPLVRLDVDLGADVSLPPVSPGGSSVVISPDGTRLAYTSGTPPKLYIRRLDQAQAAAIAGTEGAAKPFFSPDGQWVGFDGGRKLEKVSVDGGTVVPFGDSGAFGGASWGADGSIYVSIATTKGLLRYAPGGGQAQTVAPLGPGETDFAQPQILPGGKAILFTTVTGSGPNQDTMEVLTLADGRRKIVGRGGMSARYLPAPGGSGFLVYLNRSTMFAAPFDLEKLEVRGAARPVLDDVAYHGVFGAGEFDFSMAPAGHGTLLYRKGGGDETSGLMTLAWVDSTGKREALRAKPGAYQFPSISPDGRRIALAARQDEDTDIFVYDLDRDAMTRLTFGGAERRTPIWSADGRYVVFSTSGKGIFQVRAEGGSQPQALIEGKDLLVPYAFTPDGKWLAYAVAAQIWIAPVEASGGWLKTGQPRPFLKSTYAEYNAAFSPDGRLMAYTSNEPGNWEVFVRPFPPPASGPGGEWQVSNSFGLMPHWSSTGHDLFYRAGDQIMAVGYTLKGDAFMAESPRVWIPKLGATTWELAHDGRRVLVVAPTESPQARRQEHEVALLENFIDYLRQRVPLGK